ncbi:MULTISPECIES: ABC transporter substrate-binding protein [unclassified Diaminobutyricimonas]|uniref:ABC transporter substrate-binding protein n=1 Tax=unclassified Diaminobutyricimonas TaxID=2643261 RepID=UPI0012F4C270|nr:MULTISPECIES: ABC transporter substrate-binding protein [unclassified Diaminobutyricimonas]
MQSSIRRRRRLVSVATAAAVALVIAGCAPAGSSSNNEQDPATGQTFKVGVLASLTGFASALGVDLERGWNLYWEENGNTAGNFTVETVVEDDASSVDTAISKTTRLVNDEQVDVVVGPVLASQALAVADFLEQEGVANISQSSADDLTQRESSPLLLRVGAYGGSQATFPGGQWAYEEGHRTAATLCADYGFGWEGCGGFVTAFTEAGGAVTDQLWYPADASDLSSYVTQLMNMDVDLIFVANSGGTDSSNFLRSAADFGLLDRTPVLSNCCTTDQAILEDVGDIALGINSVSFFAESAPQAEEFVALYEERYGVIPSSYALGAYATAELIATALASADSKLEGEELIAAITAGDVTGTPWGDISFDEYNNITGPIMIRTVEERADGKLWNAVVKQYDDVSQFWHFDPKEFLKNPPYSPTYTGR